MSYIDERGLPTQADGDAEDQLCRIGWLLTTRAGGAPLPYGVLAANLKRGLVSDLRYSTTRWMRHAAGDPANVSGDQLVPVFAATLVQGMGREFNALALGMLFRLGFAQNYRRLNERTLKIPDPLLHRVLPFLVRRYLPLRPIVELCDLLLLLPMTLVSLLSFRGKNDVDDINHIVTLIACELATPNNFVARLCVLLYDRYRAPSHANDLNPQLTGPEGAIEWYNRADSGGNPEVGDSLKMAWHFSYSNASLMVQRSRLLSWLMGGLLRRAAP